MMTNRTILLAIPLTALLFLSGCTSGTILSTQSPTGLDQIGGTYDLILYGGQNARDLRSIAILDRTEDPYTILPYGAAFNYRIIEKISAVDALESGERFLYDLAEYRAMEKREIYSPNHTVIGYELRPIFMPLTTGFLGDILDTSYVLQPENRVTVYVDFKGNAQNQMDFNDKNAPWGH